MTQDILQSLPATRQRHSLLTVGKNLVNIPDDDPRQGSSQGGPPVGGSLQMGAAQPLPAPPPVSVDQPKPLVAPNSQPPVCPKPLKKRIVPDFGFDCEPDSRRAIAAPSAVAEPQRQPEQRSGNSNENVAPPAVIKRSVSSPTLLDLSEAATRIDTQKFRIPSPSSSQFRKSLLRNSPINLTTGDRRNAHIISPLALKAVKNIVPTGANCRKISPSGIVNLCKPTPASQRSPVLMQRSQSLVGATSVVSRTKPYSPSGGAERAYYHPKIKYLRVHQQPGGDQQAGPSGTTQASTLIALVPSNGANVHQHRQILSPKNHQNVVLRSPTERRILSPIRAAPNSPLNLKIHVNRHQ